jgi:hypothetical protein
MANLSLTRVNQKLGQAKALLHNSTVALTQVHRQSLIEAVSFHLMCAYQHYLRELAETYGLKNTLGINTAGELIKAFEMAGKYPAEAQELQELRSGQSWLAELHSFYDSLWRTPTPVSPPREGELIVLVSIDQPEAPDLESVARWHSNFVELVKRQRQTSAEF